MIPNIKGRVVTCIPTPVRPYDDTLDALKASYPLVTDAGWMWDTLYEVGSAYISWARSNMLHKAFSAGADMVTCVDHDMSWRPADMLKLIETEGDFVAGTYRYKHDNNEEYMGSLLPGPNGKVILREDGCIKADTVPAGFLKITRQGYDRFAKAFPDLLFGDRENPHVDIFNHGAYNWVWWGEDLRLGRRVQEMGDTIWLIPDLTLVHHLKYEERGKMRHMRYDGNLKRFLEARVLEAREKAKHAAA